MLPAVRPCSAPFPVRCLTCAETPFPGLQLRPSNCSGNLCPFPFVGDQLDVGCQSLRDASRAVGMHRPAPWCSWGEGDTGCEMLTVAVTSDQNKTPSSGQGNPPPRSAALGSIRAFPVGGKEGKAIARVFVPDRLEQEVLKGVHLFACPSWVVPEATYVVWQQDFQLHLSDEPCAPCLHPTGS